uniref:Uncharacterized protein n=1 Tax=Pithovirus LCPAC102 TaxID=2506587 RepID=A0A481Z3X9_9VIRU|nr:MAG: hypothetical protein LCPAC102_00740 [Pithovirus LCPAC102]
MGPSWLSWVNFILLIFIIIIIVLLSFFGGGLIKGVNYSITEFSPTAENVELKTGTNVMGIGAPTVDQTVLILPNSNNRKGLTFRISNVSTDGNDMIVQPANSVTIDTNPIGNIIEAGKSAAFIAINDNNSFLRYE